MIDSPGPMTSATPLGKPDVALAGVAVVAVLPAGVIEVDQPVVASIWFGTGSSSVAWATVVALGFATVTM